MCGRNASGENALDGDRIDSLNIRTDKRWNRKALSRWSLLLLLLVVVVVVYSRPIITAVIEAQRTDYISVNHDYAINDCFKLSTGPFLNVSWNWKLAKMMRRNR